VRNPLPAVGGVEPEPIEEAKLLAPAAFRKRLLRAITAADYATIAEDDPRLQQAAARLAWNGSWYEADVSIDPLDTETIDTALLEGTACRLHRYRRLGHDLSVRGARYVPILLSLEVCALPGYDRGDVEAALLARFSNRRGSDGMPGFFHPDVLTFGGGIYLSRIIAAAQAVPGVECVTVNEFRRLFEPPNHEIVDGLLPVAVDEIAQLDNDPNHPEHGQLQIVVRGGRTVGGR
jgi:predicted phage baseplate assembly protein